MFPTFSGFSGGKSSNAIAILSCQKAIPIANGSIQKSVNNPRNKVNNNLKTDGIAYHKVTSKIFVTYQ